MRKRFKTFIAAILLSFSSLFAVSCSGGNVITGIRMSSEEVVDVPFGNFSYDGIKVTVLFENGGDREIDLSEDMISEVERLKFFKMGEQDINVVFRDTFKTTMKVNVVLNEFNDVYELVGYTCVYDAKPHEVKLNHELPEGATIVYPKGNIFTNAGEYEIVGVISKSGYATKTLTTTLTILENKHDEDSIIFADKTVPFNGEAQTIEAENVPEGVSVSYILYDETKTTQLNKAYYAGKYCFVAKFTNADPNYKKIEDKEAYLTITKIDYDLSAISFLNVMKFYDGQTYTPSIINKEALPQGLFVHYEIYDEDGNPVIDNSAAGKYTMKAIFTGGDINHNTIEPMVATLTVAKKVVYIKDVLDFDGKQANFTGSAIYVSNPTGLPDGVNYSLDQNGFTYVGEYPIVATFTTVDPNERVDLESMTVYLLIQPSNTSVRVYEGLDDEQQPIYHDFTLKDIDIDIANNKVTIDTEPLRLSDEFLDLDCDIAIDEENEPITFKRIIVDPITGDESYVKVEPKDFVVGASYQFTVGFKLTNADAEVEAKLNDSLTISPIVGTFKYGSVKTKSSEYEYEGSFNASNIYIDNGVANIINVESGVSVESIVFRDPVTSDVVPTNELELNNIYEYEVSFKKQESAIFVNETGSFVYMNVDPFTTANLMISDEGATVVDTIAGVTVRSITLIDEDTQKVTSINNMEVGHTYNYTIFFNGIGEVGVNPGIIWEKQTGSFIYERVKDLTTDEPITWENISIEEDEINIINIDPNIVVDSIKFYNGAIEVPFTALLPEQTYTYVVSFRSNNTTLYKVETGSVKYGGRVSVKGNNEAYDANLTYANIQVLRTGVGQSTLTSSIAGLNPENTVKSIKFYNSNGDEVTPANLTNGVNYTYQVVFNHDNGMLWQVEKGSFCCRRLRTTGWSSFSGKNSLQVIDGVASIVNVDDNPEIVSIKIYDYDTKNEITDLTTLQNAHMYYAHIIVKNKDGNIWIEHSLSAKYPDNFKTE